MRRRNKKHLSIILTAALILSIFNIPMFGYAAENEVKDSVLSSQYCIFEKNNETDEGSLSEVVSPQNVNYALIIGEGCDYYYVNYRSKNQWIEDKTPRPSISWTSSNEDVASCSKDEYVFNCCKIEYQSKGTTTITASVNGKKVASVELIVRKIGIEFDPWIGHIPTKEEAENRMEYRALLSHGENDAIQMEIGDFHGNSGGDTVTPLYWMHSCK